VPRATISSVARREDTLIAQIEQETLDDSASLAGALRKCVVLGGKSGSEPLRDWATRELKGYYGDDDLPEYREVPAQIQIDGATMSGLVTGQPIARSALPDFVQEQVRERVELRDGAGAIEALVKRAEASGEAVKFSLPMGGDIARIMSADLQGQQILSIYWAVAPAAVRGVLDQIRTALTLLVAELRAKMPRDEHVPSAAVANEAVQLVVTGKRHNISVNTAQAEGDSSSATVTIPEQKEVESPFWTRSRRIGAIVVGAATIIGAVAAVIAIA
jgi:AbiTii-like protein